MASVKCRTQWEAGCRRLDDTYYKVVGSKLVPGDTAKFWLCTSFERAKEVVPCKVYKDRVSKKPRYYGLSEDGFEWFIRKL